MKDDRYRQIVALQALSTFFLQEPLNGSDPQPYHWVALPTLSHFLDCSKEQLRATLEELSLLGFCETDGFQARLTPDSWDLGSRLAIIFAAYVFNAPSPLRTPYSFLPIPPGQTWIPQPLLPQGSSATVTSNYNEVYDAAKDRSIYEARNDTGPKEELPLWHTKSIASEYASRNLFFLMTSLKVCYRRFLAALYLQSQMVQTPLGQVQRSLAELIDQEPFVVFVPSDTLQLPAAAQDLANFWMATSFLSPMDLELPATRLQNPSNYPLTMTTLGQQDVTLQANMTAAFQHNMVTTFFTYELLGPTKGGSFLIALTGFLSPS